MAKAAQAAIAKVREEMTVRTELSAGRSRADVFACHGILELRDWMEAAVADNRLGLRTEVVMP